MNQSLSFFHHLEAPIVVASYYLLGIPFAYLMAWPCHLKTFGLSLGALLGTFSNFLGFALLVLCTDWRRMAEVVAQGVTQGVATGARGSAKRGSGAGLLEG